MIFGEAFFLFCSLAVTRGRCRPLGLTKSTAYQKTWVLPFPNPVGFWALGFRSTKSNTKVPRRSVLEHKVAGLSHLPVCLLLSVLTPEWWLTQCSSKCGPWTSSTGITWELVRNAASQAPPWTAGIRNSGVGPRTLCFNKSSR